jgi:hypothetical protein
MTEFQIQKKNIDLKADLSYRIIGSNQNDF